MHEAPSIIGSEEGQMHAALTLRAETLALCFEPMTSRSEIELPYCCAKAHILSSSCVSYYFCSSIHYYVYSALHIIIYTCMDM